MIQPLEVQYDVRGYDCGYGGPLRPFSLANFFQETAGAHATALGIGMEDMAARGLTWMLSRIDIRIESLPKAGQRVIARTWPVGLKRLYAQRCLELMDESGLRYAGALYEYIIVDVHSRRVVRPERTLPIDLTTNYPLPFPDLSPGIDDVSFTTMEGFTEAFSVEARTRHIDNNGHVNNAHFVNWLCDAIPHATQVNLRRIKVDFVREIRKGTLVSSWARPLKR